MARKLAGIIPGFDDIIFENRNKEYGAYNLRKRYHRTLLVAFLFAMVALSTAVFAPYIRANTRKVVDNKEQKEEVFVRMERLDQPQEEVIRVEAPPPPPQAIFQQQIRYIAPKVVDTVINQEQVSQMITMDESVDKVQDEQVGVVEYVAEGELGKEEIPAEEPVFFIVEEMPSFQGKGEEGFREYIAQNLRYPEIALENGISGKVYVQFAVNSKGDVVDAVVVRGVDPALDKEAVRLIMSSPKWTPGKQRGNPVKVQFTFPINFVIQ